MRLWLAVILLNSAPPGMPLSNALLSNAPVSRGKEASVKGRGRVAKRAGVGLGAKYKDQIIVQDSEHLK